MQDMILSDLIHTEDKVTKLDLVENVVYLFLYIIEHISKNALGLFIGS